MVKFHYILLTYVEATGLMDIDVFVRTELGVDEGRSYITLSRYETELCSKNHHRANGGPTSDRRPCFEEIDPFLLTIASGDEPSLMFIGHADLHLKAQVVGRTRMDGVRRTYDQASRL